MSSNFIVNRVCEYCGREFEARTTVTRFCSRSCNKRANTAARRGQKIQAVKREVSNAKGKSMDDLKNKPFLNVSEVAVLLGCCRQAVNDMINSGRLSATNLGIRKTRVRREDLDALFADPEVIISPWQLQQERDIVKPMKRSECYTVTEILLKYNVSPQVLTRMLQEHDIRKEQDGQNILIPKGAIDTLFDGFQTKESEQKENEVLLPLDPKECYTIAEAGRVLDLAPSGVYYGILNRGIRKERIGQSVYVPKKEVDQWASEQLSKHSNVDTLSIQELATLLGRSQTNVREILKKHNIKKYIAKGGKTFVLKQEVDFLISIYKNY